MNPDAGARTGAAMLLIVSTCLLDARARRASVASGHHYTCVSAADTARSSRARSSARCASRSSSAASFAAGCHSLMLFLAREAGYADPQPVEPEEQRDGLIRDFLAAEERLQALARRMERIGLVRSAA